jgi:transposase-like protein
VALPLITLSSRVDRKRPANRIYQKLIAICEKMGMDENQVAKKRRARRSGKEVQRLVEEFISGGMKRSEFCRSRGLSPGTLRRHLEGGKQDGRQTPRLVAVELQEKASQKANAIEVVLGRGRRVEVRPGFDAATLQALIAVLERV